MTAPHFLNADEGLALAVYDAMLTVKATSAETAGAYSLIEARFQPGGFAPLPHIHTDREETFYVLEGEFAFRIGSDTLRAAPGAFLLVPRGVLHGFANAGTTPARLLFLHSPPLEGFFLDLAELARSGAPDPLHLSEVMRRWGMDVEIAAGPKI